MIDVDMLQFDALKEEYRAHVSRELVPIIQKMWGNGPIDMLGVALQVADAWTTALDRSISANGDCLALSNLDEYMLPAGTTQEEMAEIIGGFIKASFAHGILKSYKESLPPGQQLPAWLIDMFERVGVKIA